MVSRCRFLCPCGVIEVESDSVVVRQANGRLMLASREFHRHILVVDEFQRTRRENFRRWHFLVKLDPGFANGATGARTGRALHSEHEADGIYGIPHGWGATHHSRPHRHAVSGPSPGLGGIHPADSIVGRGSPDRRLAGEKTNFHFVGIGGQRTLRAIRVNLNGDITGHACWQRTDTLDKELEQTSMGSKDLVWHIGPNEITFRPGSVFEPKPHGPLGIVFSGNIGGITESHSRFAQIKINAWRKFQPGRRQPPMGGIQVVGIGNAVSICIPIGNKH